MGSGRGADHYATLFPRQDILDLGVGTPAADDGAEADENAPEILATDGIREAGESGSPQSLRGGGEDSTAFTWSEQHRRECEARYVMKLPLEQRRTYYQHVREKRGDPAMRELITEVNRQWKRVNET